MTLILASVSTYISYPVVLKILNWNVPVWQATLIPLIFILVVYMIWRLRQREKGFFKAIPRRPEHLLVIFDVRLFGVDWKVLYGSYFRLGNPYAFAEGPYCPSCKYELDIVKMGLRKKYHWKCIPCGRFYQCPDEGPYEADEIVEKYVESEIRGGRLKVP